MKIKSVEISGFRAFSSGERFDLDGDIILVVGVNGQGKTSLFDAILWAITGEISRLRSPESVVSLYSTTGEAQVTVEVASEDGQDLTVTRYHDGQNQRLLLQVGDQSYRGAEAEHQLIQELWAEGLTANEPRVALRLALERGVYLQQDALTGFLTADTDNERFNVISEVVGAGLVTELQVALESSRRAWSRATNQQTSQMADTEERLSRLEDQVRHFTDPSTTETTKPEEWTDWWTQAKLLGVSDLVVPNANAADAHGVIDVAISELRAIRLSRERRRERLRELSEVLRDLPSDDANLDELQQTVEEATRSLTDARDSLAEAETRVSEVRQIQLQRRSEQEELKILAEIALRHLQDHCPVCLQAYDEEATREHLNALVGADSSDHDPLPSVPDLVPLANDVHVKESEAIAASNALQNAQRLARVRLEGQEITRAGLVELTIDVPNEVTERTLAGVLESAIEENDQVLGIVNAVSARGESIALSIARIGQLARKAELEKEIHEVVSELAATRNEIESREKTGDLVTKMIESLREASSDLVESELNRIEDLLQRIYATVDPHPEFRAVRLLSRMRQGRGRLFAEVIDPAHGVRKEEPGAFLSSSQLNVLAVSVFLALNLGISNLPLRVAILDDPLQSLDDLNLLGMVDLLKRIREHRQLMVSTHNNQFASLLERKLRPVSTTQRTIRVDFSGWTSQGPITNQHDIARDPDPIRLVAD